MILGKLENSRQLSCIHPLFEKAFAWLASQKVASLENGRVEIDGNNLFALVQRYDTLPETECRMEAHVRYIDIQCVISGREYMGYAPVTGLEPADPMDVVKDIGFFKSAPESRLLLEAGAFAIFFPEDGHRTRIAVETPEAVVKIVLKIAVSP